MLEAAGQRWGSLNRRVSSFTTVVTKSQSENSFESSHVNVFLEPADIGVHVSNVLTIDKDKSLLWIKSKCDNVLDIFIRQPCIISNILLAFPFPEVLLVIGDLNHQRHVECLLHVLVEDKGKHVAQMQCFR